MTAPRKAAGPAPVRPAPAAPPAARPTAGAAAPAPGAVRPVWTPRVVLRRPLAKADRVAAGVAGGAVAVAAGLVTYYLATIWRARDPR